MPSPEEVRVQNLESELSLLKNQVQQTLLDIREHVLEFTNPFTAEARLVRAWQERTAQAAQTNLGGEADLESLMDVDDDYGDEPADDRRRDDDDIDSGDDEYDLSDLEDDVEEADIDVESDRPQPAPRASASAASAGDDYDEPAEYDEPAVYDEPAGYDDAGYEQPGYEDYEDEYEPAAYERPSYDNYRDNGYAAPEAAAEDYAAGDWDESEPDAASGPERMAAGEDSYDMYESADGMDDLEPAYSEERPAAPAPQQPIQQMLAGQSSIDMIKMISLVRWVDQNIDRIGKDRVMVILDIHAMSGRITEEIRDIVKRLCALDRDDDTRVPVRDVVAAMLTIEDVLDDQQSQSRRLLSMLFDDPIGGLPRGGAGLL